MKLFTNKNKFESVADFRKKISCFNLNGKTVFCYSRLLSFGKIPSEKTIYKILKILIDSITPDGTLIIPTYTFSAYNSEVFDPNFTPCRVGILGELARKSKGFKRSIHPVYSHACWGKYADYLCINDHNYSCFGKESLFDKFSNLKDPYILILGTTLSVITGAHYYDQKFLAPGRYIKIFNAKIRENSGKIKNITFDSYVKDYSFYKDIVPCFAGFEAIAEKLGVLKRVMCVNSWICGIEEKKFQLLYKLCLKYDQLNLLCGSKEEFIEYYQNNNFKLKLNKIPSKLFKTIKDEFLKEISELTLN